MEWMLGQKRQLSPPKLSYLHVSKLKKRNRNRETLFNFWTLVLLKGSTFHINDKKISEIGTFTLFEVFSHVVVFDY